MPPPAWLPVADAAKEANLSERTLQRWAGGGLIRSRRVGARVLEINRASLMARLADRPKPGPKAKEVAK